MQNLSDSLGTKNANVPDIPYNELCQCMFYVCGGHGGGSAAIQKMINAYKIPLDIRDKNGATPLHAAVAAANVDAVRTLLHAGSPVNLRHGGKTPAQMCINNPALFGIFRMQAIQCIAEGKADMFTQLLESGIPASRTADDDQSLLHWAATFARPNMIQALLNHGANVNAVSAKGETALHLAVRERDRECVQLLLRGGADADMADRAGKTARDIDNDGVLAPPPPPPPPPAAKLSESRADSAAEGEADAPPAENLATEAATVAEESHDTSSDASSPVGVGPSSALLQTPKTSHHQSREETLEEEEEEEASPVAAAGSATPQSVEQRLPWLVKMMVLIPWSSDAAPPKAKAVAKQMPFALRRRRRRDGNGERTSKFSTPTRTVALAVTAKPKPKPPPKPKIMDWTTQSVMVKAGSKFQFPISIDEAGAELRWSFETKGGDIAFGLGFNAKSSGAMQMLQPLSRVVSDVEQVDAAWTFERAGVAVVIWDNTFSWYTDKDLTFSLQLKSPAPDPSETPPPTTPKVATQQQPRVKRSAIVRSTPGATPLCRRVVEQTLKHRSALAKLSYWQRERSRMRGVVQDLAQQLQTAQHQLEEAQARYAEGAAEQKGLSEDIAQQCMEKLWQRQDVNLMDFIVGKANASSASTDDSRASLAVAFKILSM